eukprot:GHRR01033922.1.p1 GENE.GHRR01033922.1~~GHRR01033922.1.p1  ORF type:complete len:122 (+),score=34.93 GHRR01033922.1:524-889(+)
MQCLRGAELLPVQLLQPMTKVTASYLRAHLQTPALHTLLLTSITLAAASPAGEPELLMTSRVLQRPICVYQPGSSSWGFGSSSPQLIVTYGDEYRKAATPMHLLWSGAHYDLLVPQPTSKL